MVVEAYLAAPIFNERQRTVVTEMKVIMESAQLQVFSPYHASREIWRGRAPMDCTPEERAQVLRGNVQHLHCDIVVAWVGGNEGGFTDPGVVWELGYAAALSGAPAVWGSDATVPFTLGYIAPTDVRRSMNLMLSGTLDAVVLGHTELSLACELAAKRYWDRIRTTFHPDRLLQQEKEPIV